MLVVDGANVVGSRPDGWWRDRPGAARRLHEELRAALSAGRLVAPVVLVLEGAARAGVPAADVDGVRVVHAGGSGDDAIVALTTPGVVVVTADRALRDRVVAAGGSTARPSWLRQRLG